MASKLALAFAAHHARLAACRACPKMIGPVVVPPAVATRVLVVGQAPGPREGALGRPFAWTAGKTLFRWMHTIGSDEAAIRERVYFAAVCRCFPGKGSSGGDRVPAPDEIARCRPFLAREVELLRPELVIPVGRLAIQEILGTRAPLDAIVGTAHHVNVLGHETDVIPLPHPSGASSWFKKEPGVTLLARALELIGRHDAWRAAVD